MTLLFKVLNNNLDNDLLFYSVFVGVVGAMGYALARKIIRKSYIEKGVQTEAEKKIFQIAPIKIFQIMWPQ